MSKLVVVVSGHKGSGKNTLANQIVAIKSRRERVHELDHLFVNDRGKLFNRQMMIGGPTPYVDEEVVFEPGTSNVEATYAAYGVRQMSFATPLKEFCEKVLHLTHDQCWGTDEQKNTLTHLRWEDLPFLIRLRYSGARWLDPRTWVPRSGRMTARQVMQVFGTDLIRAWYPKAWVRTCYREAMVCADPVVLITDGRFPNEVFPDVYDPEFDYSEQDVLFVRVRLTRRIGEDNHPSETVLDVFRDEEFDLVVPPNLSVKEQEEFVKPTVEGWLDEIGLKCEIPMSMRVM